MAYVNASDIDILCKGTIYDLTLFAKNQGYNFSCNVIDFENYYHYGTANKSVLNLQNVTSDMVLLETASGKIELKMDGQYLIDLHITDANNRHYLQRVINKSNTGATYFTIYFGIDETNQLGSIALLTWRSGSNANFNAFGDSLGNGFYNNNYAYNLIKGLVPPQYNWQSVPSISGKNGILQSLVQIKEEAINDGEPVSEATVLSFDSLGNINIPSVIDEQMPVDPSDVTSVTATYLIPALENGTYESIKLLVKKGSIPTSEQDADKVVNLDEPTSILRIDSKSVGNLDEDSHYYFVVKLVDEVGTEATSEPKDIWTSHSEGWNFDYTGEIQTFVAPKTGIYQLETWGAQGGDATDGTRTARGGYGAYAVGEVFLSQGDTLYINVGGQNGYGGGGGFNPYRQVNSWEASDGNTYDCLKINDYSIIPQSIKDSTTMTYSKLTNGGSLPSYIEEQGDLIHTSVYSDIANNIQIKYCDNEKLKIIHGKYYSTQTYSSPFYGVAFYDVRVSTSIEFCGEGWMNNGSIAVASYIGVVLDVLEHRGYIIWDAYLTNHSSRNGHNIYVIGGKSNGVDIIWETFKNAT